MKKFLSIALAAILILSMPLSLLANETAPVPVRDFFAEEGAAFTWDEPLTHITITLGGKTVTLYIGSHTIYVDNSPVGSLAVPLAFDGQRTFITPQDARRILNILTAEPRTHGEIAVRYLHFIEENLPGRIGFTQRERDTAEWIAAELEAMGYNPDYIRLQAFPISGMMPFWLEMLGIGEGLEPVEEIPPSLVGSFASLNIYSMEDLLAMEFLDYSQNVIMTVPGQSERRIIVGAHYDSPNSPGISDNASGVVTLLETAYRMLGVEHYYTITYIFFGAEELGLLGAFHYVEQLTQEEIDNIALMVNVDVIFDGFELFFGAGHLDFENGGETQNSATQMLISLASELNTLFNLELIHAPGSVFVSSDQLAFLPTGAPILVFWAVQGMSFEHMTGDWELSEDVADTSLSAQRAALIQALLDSEATLYDLAEEADILLMWMSIFASITEEMMLSDIEMMQDMLDTLDDEAQLAILEYQLELLNVVLEIMAHPNFAAFVLEHIGEIAPMELEAMYAGIGWGLVLHTLNDNLTYLNENFPGLIERALDAYLLFLEAVLTLPEGSLE